jgi:hypothetical protein
MRLLKSLVAKIKIKSLIYLSSLSNWNYLWNSGDYLVFILKKILFRIEFFIVKLSVKNMSLREGSLDKVLKYVEIINKKRLVLD